MIVFLGNGLVMEKKMNKMYKVIIYKNYWTGDKSYFGESSWMTEEEFYMVHPVMKKPSMFGNDENFSIKILTKESD